MKNPNKKIKVLLADDHSLIRQGLAFLLEDIDEEFIIHQASSLHQALEIVRTHDLDFIIIDAHFPDGNSIQIIPEIKKLNEAAKILIFTGIDEKTYALKFINEGANGFLSKLNEEEQIKEAIEQMLEKGEYISPLTQNLLINSLRNPVMMNPLQLLTEREKQIAEMYGKGLGNLEIANALDIKQNTVSTIKKRIFEKLNVDNIVELIEILKQNE